MCEFVAEWYNNDAAAKKLDEPGIIPIADIMIGKRIEGADVTTFSGKWEGMEVAIKTVDRLRIAPLVSNAAHYTSFERQENVARFCGLCVSSL